MRLEDLDDHLATSGYVVRKGACTNHSLAVGVLTQTRHDSRWGEVRMLAPAQVKLNWVSAIIRPRPASVRIMLAILWRHANHTVRSPLRTACVWNFGPG